MAHKIYGVPQTINSANYVYFLAMNELFQLEPGSFLFAVSARVATLRVHRTTSHRSLPATACHRHVFSDLRPVDHLLLNYRLDELLNLHRGQGLELYWRDALVCPTEEDYISMVNNSESLSYVIHSVLNQAPETGGLFRIGIKLMMACGTTNTDTCVVISLWAEHR